MTTFRELPRPALFAHRGARTQAPENSLEAFELALRAGAHAIETDVRCTADGQVVVTHDAGGRRTARVDRAVAECTLAEIKAWDVGSGAEVVRGNGPCRMPTLAEALAAFPRTPFNVDLKAHHDAAVDAVLAVVAELDAAERVLLTSFSSAVLRRVRARGYAGPIGLARTEAIFAVLGPEGVARVVARGAARLQIPTRYGPLALDRRWVVDRAHALGLLLDYWVVNDPALAARLIELGADGIVSDEPGRLASTVAPLGAAFSRAPA